jgi:hypothetical protein
LGKGSTVNFLIIPEENQLVKAALFWEVYEYSMIMDKPRGDWLPREFFSYQTGPLGSTRRSRHFRDYAKTDVKAKFWFEDVKVKIWYETDELQPKP